MTNEECYFKDFIDEEMTKAVFKQDIKLAKALIKFKPNVNIHNGECLMFACKYGNIELINLLIENGADVNANNSIAIRYAIEHKHPKAVKILVENGSNVEDYYLSKAVVKEDVETVGLLIPHVNINNSDALQSALSKFNIPIFKTLIEHGADIHIEDDKLVKGEYLNFGNKKLLDYLVFERNIILSDETKNYLIKKDYIEILDLIDLRNKIEFEKSLQQEIRQIPETNNKKKVNKI